MTLYKNIIIYFRAKFVHLKGKQFTRSGRGNLLDEGKLPSVISVTEHHSLKCSVDIRSASSSVVTEQ
jgi:hypothetical protein